MSGHNVAQPHKSQGLEYWHRLLASAQCQCDHTCMMWTRSVIRPVEEERDACMWKLIQGGTMHVNGCFALRDGLFWTQPLFASCTVVLNGQAAVQETLQRPQVPRCTQSRNEAQALFLLDPSTGKFPPCTNAAFTYTVSALHCTWTRVSAIKTEGKTTLSQKQQRRL